MHNFSYYIYVLSLHVLGDYVPITRRNNCTYATLGTQGTYQSFIQNSKYQVYFFFLHVSGDYVPIIRRKNCIYATLGTCYSVWMTVWYACRVEFPSILQDLDVIMDSDLGKCEEKGSANSVCRRERNLNG